MGQDRAPEVGTARRRVEWSGAPLVDAVEVDAEYGDLLVLDVDGIVSGIDLATGVPRTLATVGQAFDEPPPENRFHVTPRLGLHADHHGRFAAVAQDFGSAGVVIDLASGEVVMRLDAGRYHPETVPASLAFIDHPTHGTVLVHRTNWNRLDATALPSGECLTSRDFDDDWRSKDCPPLDYFYGAIHPSPSGRWLLSDGWVWSPVAIPYVIDVVAWLDGDRYRPENDYRGCPFSFGNDWTSPCVWLDDSHVALWWKPEANPADNDWFDGHPLAPLVARGDGAVFILDVEPVRPPGNAAPGLTALPIPVSARPQPFDWPVGRLFADGDQLIVYDGESTTLWDYRAGQPTAACNAGTPRLLHHGRSTLISFDHEGLIETPLPGSRPDCER